MSKLTYEVTGGLLSGVGVYPVLLVEGIDGGRGVWDWDELEQTLSRRDSGIRDDVGWIYCILDNWIE